MSRDDCVSVRVLGDSCVWGDKGISGEMDDTAIAASLAEGAGRLLREVQQQASPEELGSADLKDRGDRISQRYLDRELTENRAADAVLSEEAPDDAGRLDASRVWIIDPLDGTREFSEGRDDWAVHVALWEDGELAAGAVALPGLGETLDTGMPAKTWSRPDRIRLAVSRSRATPLVSALAEALDAELIPMGSAGYKACAVIRGEVDAYVHTGGQYEWDSAAPVAVARAAGLFTSRVDGSALEYNNANPYLPDLVVCNPLLADEVLRAVGALNERAL
ncbi:3'(2'),5'-bisphosphate nucleotidase CysQ [Microbacterium sp. AR7-10]|nr:3'(2'),5'-bisphosphate nucleotidase CysQ [Microbacterium sp. AR7-10]